MSYGPCLGNTGSATGNENSQARATFQPSRYTEKLCSCLDVSVKYPKVVNFTKHVLLVAATVPIPNFVGRRWVTRPLDHLRFIPKENGEALFPLVILYGEHHSEDRSRSNRYFFLNNIAYTSTFTFSQSTSIKIWATVTGNEVPKILFLFQRSWQS